MPAVASLEDLKKADQDLKALRERHAEAYEEVAAILRRHRKVGYKNICRMLLGEATPEELKGS
jgi:hypothetical protein